MRPYDLNAGSHSEAITDISIATKKPLIATCSSDRSLKIWNYKNKKCEISKLYGDTIFSVSLHPSGLHLLVGFSDRLKLMNLLLDDLRIFQSFPIRACKLTSFSHGGHLFAAVFNNVVVIYNFSKFEVVANLQGHSSKVRCIQWSKNDEYLVTSGADGAIYQWDPIKGTRCFDHVLRTTDYTSITISDENVVYACDSNGTLKEIKQGEVLKTVKLEESFSYLTMSGKGLFGTTSFGHLRIINLPLETPLQFTEKSAHATSADILIASSDNYNLVSCSSDGSIIVWNRYDEINFDRKAVNIDVNQNWSEEVLVSKNDLEEKNNQIEELTFKVNELKSENEYESRLKDLNHQEQLKDLTEKFIQEMDALKARNFMLKSEKEDQLQKFNHEIFENNDAHYRQKVEIEQTNNKKLMFEYERYQDLQNKLQKVISEYDQKIAQEKIKKDNDLNKWSEDFEEMFEKWLRF